MGLTLERVMVKARPWLGLLLVSAVGNMGSVHVAVRGVATLSSLRHDSGYS